MSISEFYVEHGLGQDYDIDEWLRDQQDNLSGCESVGRRKRKRTGVSATLACPACNKMFGSEAAMADHCLNKSDAAHIKYRRENGRDPKPLGGGGGNRGDGRGAGPSRSQPRDSHTAPSKEQVRTQVEYYLSAQNLIKRCQFSGVLQPKDRFLLQEMARAKGGWVRLSVLAAFPRLKQIVPSGNAAIFADAVECSSTLELSPCRNEVRRVTPLPGAVGAMAHGELVLLMEDEWVHAVWKDEEGFLQVANEKNQQAQQLGCIDEADVNEWFASGAAFPGAIDLRSDADTDEERPPLEVSLAPGTACRWGAACPRLSTDDEHTAAAHTAAQARLAASKGASAAVRALGGRWITASEVQAKIEAVALRPDACPCFKGGSSSCVMPGAHGRDYWQGEATVVRLSRLEPHVVDQNPEAWAAKREAKGEAKRREEEHTARLQRLRHERLGGAPPPSFLPSWPDGAFERLPAEVLARVCQILDLRSLQHPTGDMTSDVRRLVFLSKTITRSLRSVRPAISIRAAGGARALQLERGGCWTVGRWHFEDKPVQKEGPSYWARGPRDERFPRTLGAAAQCRALHTIELTYARDMKSIDELADCPELRQLILYQTDGLRDVSSLARCPKLERLSLSVGEFVESRFDPKCLLALLASPSLSSLDASCPRLFSSFAIPAPSGPRLRHLALRDSRGWGDAKGLTGDWSVCVVLETLILADSRIRSVALLARCPALHTLDLVGCEPLEDARWLSECRPLRRINVGAKPKPPEHAWQGPALPKISDGDVAELMRLCPQLCIYNDNTPNYSMPWDPFDYEGPSGVTERAYGWPDDHPVWSERHRCHTLLGTRPLSVPGFLAEIAAGRVAKRVPGERAHLF